MKMNDDDSRNASSIVVHRATTNDQSSQMKSFKISSIHAEPKHVKAKKPSYHAWQMPEEVVAGVKNVDEYLFIKENVVKEKQISFLKQYEQFEKKHKIILIK